MTPAPDPASFDGFPHAWRRGHRLHGAWMLLLAAACVPAWGAPTCTVASGATLSFGVIIALAAAGDAAANSGTSLWVNCTSDVTSSPTLYSATARTLMSGGNSLPFALSASAPGGIELPTASPGISLGILRNGTQQSVTLYAKITANNFRSLPSGLYSRSLTLTVEY